MPACSHFERSFAAQIRAGDRTVSSVVIPALLLLVLAADASLLSVGTTACGCRGGTKYVHVICTRIYEHVMKSQKSEVLV
jgi:hypothetical protein